MNRKKNNNHKQYYLQLHHPFHHGPLFGAHLHKVEPRGQGRHVDVPKARTDRHQDLPQHAIKGDLLQGFPALDMQGTGNGVGVKKYSSAIVYGN